ncbi:MAG: hypothetical protein R2909_22450 [Gemmatimonadales bacterium]
MKVRRPTNPGLQLKPGMFAEVEIEMRGAAAAPSVLAVPLEALQRDGQSRSSRGAGAGPVPAPHRPDGGRGWRGGPIRDGLNAGEVVVTRGAFALKAELRRGELGLDEH